jgi:hypothetical protein
MNKRIYFLVYALLISISPTSSIGFLSPVKNFCGGMAHGFSSVRRGYPSAHKSGESLLRGGVFSLGTLLAAVGVYGGVFAGYNSGLVSEDICKRFGLSWRDDKSLTVESGLILVGCVAAILAGAFFMASAVSCDKEVVEENKSTDKPVSNTNE